MFNATVDGKRRVKIVLLQYLRSKSINSDIILEDT